MYEALVWLMVETLDGASFILLLWLCSFERLLLLPPRLFEFEHYLEVLETVAVVFLALLPCSLGPYWPPKTLLWYFFKILRPLRSLDFLWPSSWATLC